MGISFKLKVEIFN